MREGKKRGELLFCPRHFCSSQELELHVMAASTVKKAPDKNGRQTKFKALLVLEIVKQDPHVNSKALRSSMYSRLCFRKLVKETFFPFLDMKLEAFCSVQGNLQGNPTKKSTLASMSRPSDRRRCDYRAPGFAMSSVFLLPFLPMKVNFLHPFMPSGTQM